MNIDPNIDPSNKNPAYYNPANLHYFHFPSGRVLSRIYRLGEKFRVAEGNNLPRRVRGSEPPPPPHPTPRKFLEMKYTLRCNLVHFETQF